MKLHGWKPQMTNTNNAYHINTHEIKLPGIGNSAAPPQLRGAACLSAIVPGILKMLDIFYQYPVLSKNIALNLHNRSFRPPGGQRFTFLVRHCNCFPQAE
jgi:hypothetical protein